MAGIKIPITYEYNLDSINQMKSQFNSIVKDAELGPAFDAELKAINAKFDSIGTELKKQLASGKIDLEALGLTDLEKMIEKFAKGMAFVLDEALDDTEIERYSKEVTKLGDEIIAKQKEIKNLQKQRKDLEDDKGAFKAKFGLARMPTLDPLEAERRLAAAQQELAASGGGAANEDLEKRISMFKELIALLNKEQQARTGFYTNELNKAKNAAKEAEDELVGMAASGFGTPTDKSYRPVTFGAQQTINTGRQDIKNLFSAMDGGNEAEAAALYNKMVVDVQELANLEEKRNRLIAERDELEKKSKEGYDELLKTSNEAFKARDKAAKKMAAIDPASEKLKGLKAEFLGGAKDISLTGIQGPNSDFRFQFKQQIEGLNNEIPASLEEARNSYKQADGLLQQAIESGNKDLQDSLQKRLDDLQRFRDTYRQAIVAAGFDPNLMASMNVESILGKSKDASQNMYDRQLRIEQDAASKMGELRGFGAEANEKQLELITTEAEVQALKEKEAALERIKQVEADIAAQKLAAREDFQSKFGMQGMPTEDLDQAKNMLAGAQEELAQGAAGGDPALQNKVALYRELVELLQKEKQNRQDIEDQVTTKQAEITDLTNKKQQTQNKLDERKLKLGEESENQSRRALEINTAINTFKQHGIQLTNEQIKQAEEAIKLTKKSNDEGDREKKGLIARAGATFSYGLVIGQLRRVYQQTIKTVRELDKAMTEAAIVTSMNRKEAYQLLGAYQQLARDTGLATSEVSGIVVEFLKQGRTMKEAMELAGVAAKAAKVAGIDARQAVDYLTAAVNGFNLAATEAESIADKFSAISAASATDFEELAIAMSKVAPTAKTAGIGVDFMMGVLAKGLEVTREAPENIGTAFKTIFARMREVTDIGKATEDGMSLNRVEKALASINVPLRDTAGQFRNLETVLIEVGDKWNTLTSIEQAYIATALAGTRQQPRLLAIFNDFARTKELIEISTQATGALSFQHIEYMQGAEAALAQLKTAWEGFVMAFTDADIVVGAIKMLADLVNGLTNFFDFLGESTAKNIIALIAAGFAIVGLGVKTATLNIEKKKSIIIEQQLKTLDADKLKRYGELNKQLDTATGKTRKKVQAEMMEILGLNLKRNWLRQITTEIYIQIAAMAKQILITAIATAGISLLGAAMAWLTSTLFKASKTSAEFSQEIMENSKQIDDLEQKENSVKKLVERFEELSRKVVKTSEELNEMKTIAEELGSVKIGEEEFNLSRRDITGKIVLDKVAYENFLAAVEQARQDLLDANISAFQGAVKGTLGDVAKLFEEDKTLLQKGRSIGYDFGVSFLLGMKENGFSDSEINKAMENLQRSMARIEPSMFLRITNPGDVRNRKNNVVNFIDMMRNSLGLSGDEGRNITDSIFNTLLNNVPSSVDQLNEVIASELEKLGIDVNSTAGQALANSFSENFQDLDFAFDKDKAEQFSQEMAQLFINAAAYAETSLSMITTPTTRDVLFANYMAYKNTIDAIRDEFTGNQAEIDLRVNLLKESMQDEAIMDMFFNKNDPTLAGREATLDFLVSVVESGVSLSDLSDLTENITEALNEMGLSSNRTAQSLQFYNEALYEAFSNRNFEAAYRLINDIFGEGSDEARTAINELSNALNTLNATTAATALTEQGKAIQDLLKLPEQIAKGDFSKYADAVATFGADMVNEFLTSGSINMDGYFQDEADKFAQQIKDAKDNILQTYLQSNPYSLQYDESGLLIIPTAIKEQLDQLDLMLNYYDQIAGVDQLRLASLKEAKDLVKQTNDLYSLQQKIQAFGASSGASEDLLLMLDKLAALAESKALESLENQLNKDIKVLNELGSFNEDGVFIINPDMIVEGNAALAKTQESLAALIDAQTAAYNRQKKIIEERYKAEVDAVKTANDEKWKAIEYTDKLIDMEEKIVQSRRSLLGLSLSGVSSGVLGDAQKDLEKIQKERQKMIESQMVADAEKELAKQRDLALERLGEQQIAAMETLTTALENLTEAIEDRTVTGGLTVDPGDLLGA